MGYTLLFVQSPLETEVCLCIYSVLEYSFGGLARHITFHVGILLSSQQAMVLMSERRRRANESLYAQVLHIATVGVWTGEQRASHTSLEAIIVGTARLRN